MTLYITYTIIAVSIFFGVTPFEAHDVLELARLNIGVKATNLTVYVSAGVYAFLVLHHFWKIILSAILIVAIIFMLLHFFDLTNVETFVIF